MTATRPAPEGTRLGELWRILPEEATASGDGVLEIGGVAVTELAERFGTPLHVYLTVPFVLSWSCVEALAAGCLVLGSATAPVVEVVRDGENGFLVDFFAPDAIAARAAALLAERRGLDRVRQNARQTVLDRYSVARCLPRHLRLVAETAARR